MKGKWLQQSGQGISISHVSADGDGALAAFLEVEVARTGWILNIFLREPAGFSDSLNEPFEKIRFLRIGLNDCKVTM